MQNRDGSGNVNESSSRDGDGDGSVMAHVDRTWCLQVARSLRRKTRRLSDDVVPKGVLGTRDGREKMAIVFKNKYYTRPGEGLLP